MLHHPAMVTVQSPSDFMDRIDAAGRSGLPSPATHASAFRVLRIGRNSFIASARSGPSRINAEPRLQYITSNTGYSTCLTENWALTTRRTIRKRGSLSEGNIQNLISCVFAYHCPNASPDIVVIDKLALRTARKITQHRRQPPDRKPGNQVAVEKRKGSIHRIIEQGWKASAIFISFCDLRLPDFSGAARWQSRPCCRPPVQAV